MLSQDFTRYHYDAKTNIGLGDVGKISHLEDIIDSAKLSGADSFIQDYKRKYNQILNRRFSGGIEPSVGQWQKIAIARAFFRNPQVLILDEPTSAIDPKAESEIFDNLFTYAKAKTVIIISHRFSTVRNANKIIVLDKGKIIEAGTHEELISLGGKYKTAFELQRRGFRD